MVSWQEFQQAMGPWLSGLGYFVALLGMAGAVHLLSNRIAHALVGIGQLAPDEGRLRPERMEIVVNVISDAITAAAVLIAVLVAVARFEAVAADDIVWVVGLLSAGFGLAARPLIADYFHGLSFVFGDRFAVGEKVALPGAPGGEIEGVVESVNLSDLHLRAQSGELYVVPNGEVRVVRNFSRGLHSSANVRLRVPSEQLEETLDALDRFREEAVIRIPDLLEPWEVISEDGLIGEDTVLTLVINARFGTAATLRPRILAFLQRRLAESEIRLVD